MTTAESVKGKIQGLISQANGVTGKTDADLTTAIGSLIAGFGQGGGSGGGGASGVYMAKVTPAEDDDELKITHNLGTTDILFALCWVETLGDIVPTFAGALGKFWTKTDIPNARNCVGFSTQGSYNMSNGMVNLGVPNSNVYWDEVIDENTFRFERAGSAGAKFIAGVTYTVIIMAASAFKETEG